MRTLLSWFAPTYTRRVATCAVCGEESPPRARFCWSCGAELAAAPVEDERRVVTVLFVDLVGSTAWAEGRDPEDVLRVLDAYHESARAELERFGGTVAKFIGDGVMGLFGAQVAHEDDPERAVRAALAIRAAVTALFATLPDAELHLRIGVHTGEAAVTTRTVGTGTTADVAGDVVNTCARIESAAPADAILVGEATYRATSGAIEYRAAPPVLARGKAEPVPVWEAVAPLAA